MALSHIRHNIQVKEETFCFFNDECCERKYYDEHEDSWYPDRCGSCNKKLKSWQRGKKSQTKWKKLFKKNFRRWRFVKMLTITTPPYFHMEAKDDMNQTPMFEEKINPKIGHSIEESYYVRNILEKKTRIMSKEYYKKIFRDKLRQRFKLLRKRSKYWNKVVDGGQWFYECPITDEGITNPHMHVLLVGPKLIDQEKLQEELTKYKLGSISHFSSPKNKQGAIQKMTYWRNRKLIVNMSAVSRVLNYVDKYMRKDEQIDGKNNSWFGSLYN